MAATLLLRQHVDLALEPLVGLDRARLGKHLTTLDALAGDATQQTADVVAGLTAVEEFLEHLDAGAGRLLGLVLEADDLDFVANLHLAALDSASRHRATTFDREHVLDRHQERLVELTNRLGDVGVDRVEQVADTLVFLRVFGAVVGRLAGTTDDRHIVAGESVLRQQFADFHLDEVEKLRVVDEIDLVEKYHQRRHADLLGKEDVLPRLRHRAVGGTDNEDGAVHLGGTGDHVLDEVGVTRAVDVGVVPLESLVLYVTDGDGHRLRFVTNRATLGDICVALGHGQILRCLNSNKRACQRGLAVVDVSNRADVDVRLAPRERVLCHALLPRSSSLVAAGRWACVGCESLQRLVVRIVSVRPEAARQDMSCGDEQTCVSQVHFVRNKRGFVLGRRS